MLKLIKVYRWKGVTQQGQVVSGTYKNNQLTLARLGLKRKGILVTQIKPTWRFTWIVQHISAQAISHFSTQLAYLLKAEFALLPALNALVSHYHTDSDMQNVLMNIQASLEEGITFSHALSRYPNYFNPLYCSLIGISEQCGELDTQLIQLSDYYEKLWRIQSKVYKALYYPISLLSIALIVTTLLIVWVVPQFESLFASTNASLPWLTKQLIALSHGIRHFGQVIVIGIAGMVVLTATIWDSLIVLLRSWNTLLLRIPWVGKQLQQATVARFAYTLSMTLKAGLPILEALAITKSVMQYRTYQTAIDNIEAALVEGMALDKAIQAVNYFPPLLVQMIKTGQLSGRLENNLVQCANFFEDKMNNTIENTISLLEPVLLSVLGMVIGVLMIALYSPIFELGNAVGLSEY